YQRKVYTKERALEHFIESNFIDCRINAFPSLKEGATWVPELVFIDLDRNNFKTEKGFKLALSITLKNIREKLGNDDDDDAAQPTVLFTGGGYHIYQPVNCPIALESITEFQKFEKPSQEFLRFAKDNLSNDKADKKNNPSFRSCLLRIPGSINSKYDSKVTIVQKWNKVRPPIPREFIEEFRTYLIQKKIDEKKQRQKMLLKLKRQNNKNGHNNTNRNYYEWIDKKILANPFSDYRKIIINLILAPYLIVIKKLSFEESYPIIYEWLQKCDLLSGRKLDFNSKSVVNSALTTAYKKQIPPMSMITLKTNYKDLYFLIEQKGKIEGRGG
ncbi:MAG TPA: DNA primase noncatalytic subunit PriX, partial [Nitrososphaeraceae archaeon]|nr:DNA primase noncatalytic subunit PriX [Nitrososphaeraceae archaeon]